MTHESAALPSAARSWRRRRSMFTLANRFVPPLLITCILIAAHLSFGILEGYTRTALAIATAHRGGAGHGRGSRTADGRIRPAPTSRASASASWCGRRFSGPTSLASLISIASKYVLRVEGPPSLESVELRRQRRAVSGAGHRVAAQHSVGQHIWPMVVIWMLGTVIVWRVGRLHISATYVASFLLFSLVRSAITGNPWLANVAPITGPMYQLFIFFMVTDPKTTVRPKSGAVSSSCSSSRSWRRCCGLRKSSTRRSTRCSCRAGGAAARSVTEYTRTRF